MRFASAIIVRIGGRPGDSGRMDASATYILAGRVEECSVCDSAGVNGSMPPGWPQFRVPRKISFRHISQYRSDNSFSPYTLVLKNVYSFTARPYQKANDEKGNSNNENEFLH